MAQVLKRGNGNRRELGVSVFIKKEDLIGRVLKCDNCKCRFKVEDIDLSRIALNKGFEGTMFGPRVLPHYELACPECGTEITAGWEEEDI